jgi:hypothetical protein
MAFGPGAEDALRGRGGLRARILTNGILRAICPSRAGCITVADPSRGPDHNRSKAGHHSFVRRYLDVTLQLQSSKYSAGSVKLILPPR